MPVSDHLRKCPVWIRPLRGIQIFGDYGKWHPHIVTLTADGLFSENGYLYAMPKVDIHPLAELFRISVLKKLKDKGRYEYTVTNKIPTLQHNSDFSFHKEVSLHAGDE